MNNEQKKKAIPELSVDVQVLWRRIQKLAPGEIVPYAELNQLIRGDVQKKMRPTLYGARRKALRDDNIVTECVINTGVKRLEDSAISTIHIPTLNRIRKASRLACRKQQCANYDALTSEQKTSYNAGQSVLGVLAHVAKPKSVKLVEDATAKKLNPISFKETLSLFSNGETKD